MSNLKRESVMVNKGLRLLARASHSSPAVTLNSWHLSSLASQPFFLLTSWNKDS